MKKQKRKDKKLHASKKTKRVIVESQSSCSEASNSDSSSSEQSSVEAASDSTNMSPEKKKKTDISEFLENQLGIHEKRLANILQVNKKAISDILALISKEKTHVSKERDNLILQDSLLDKNFAIAQKKLKTELPKDLELEITGEKQDNLQEAKHLGDQILRQMRSQIDQIMS